MYTVMRFVPSGDNEEKRVENFSCSLYICGFKNLKQLVWWFCFLIGGFVCLVCVFVLLLFCFEEISLPLVSFVQLPF